MRNGGSGLAVIHGWRVEPRGPRGAGSNEERPDVEEFRRQQIDLYIPAGEVGFWLGALRDPSEASFRRIVETDTSENGIQLDIMYGDHEGGQRTIVRFALPFPLSPQNAAGDREPRGGGRVGSRPARPDLDSDHPGARHRARRHLVEHHLRTQEVARDHDGESPMECRQAGWLRALLLGCFLQRASEAWHSTRQTYCGKSLMFGICVQ